MKPIPNILTSSALRCHGCRRYDHNSINRQGRNTQSGSVMVGVLVAIAFISVVTAFMVKNTGSQSLASRSYAGVQTAQLSVSNGIVATASYFSRTGNLEDILDMLDSAMTDGQYRPYIYGGSKESDKIEIAGGQRFCSQLVRFDTSNMISHIEIASGRNVQRAHAFFNMGNLKVESDAIYGARNAVYMKGALRNGDNGMEVHGDALFEGYAKFQNRPGVFRGNTFFTDDVHIMNGQTVFGGKTYIGGNAVFQNFNSSHTVFEGDVGINGNLNTEGNSNPIRAGGDVFFNGDFGNQFNLGTNQNIQSANANKTFYYTDKFSIRDPARCPPSGTCSLHPRGHINSNNIKEFSNMVNTYNSMNIIDRLQMGNIVDRRDPQIDISRIDNSIIRPASNALGVNFTVANLNKAYEEAKANDMLYNDHLVLKFRRNDPNVNFSSQNPGVFNGKVIFIIEDGATFNAGMNFYHSGPNSSTMIYAGAGNAQLQQFGSSGPFRGLIYIDSLNTASNSFNWRNGGSIEGAVHNFSDRDFVWNGGNSAIPIHFNENVLNAFAPLVKGAATGGGGSIAIADTTDMRVNVSVVGVYFY